MLGLTDTAALSANEARFQFRFRVFFGACTLQNEVSDPNFFCLFDNSISLPLSVASLKTICAWERLGAKVLNRGKMAFGVLRGTRRNDMMKLDEGDIG